MKLNLKTVSITVLVLILAGGAFYFFQNRKTININNGGNNGQSLTNSQDVEAIAFARNVIFAVPNNSVINLDSSTNSVIIVDKSVGQYDPSSYKDLLSKKAIIIQSFPPLNKNKKIFQNYITERYKTTDKITSDIKFTSTNGFKKAVIKITHKDDLPAEYVEVINLDSPVIIASSEKSTQFTKISSTIKNISSASKDVTEIRKELQLVGTLLRTNMTSDLYSQFSSKAQKNMSKKDLQSTLDGAKNTIKNTITVNGGLWLKSKNQFVCKPSFKDPTSSKKEVKKGQLILTKENGKWLISSLDIPKD